MASVKKRQDDEQLSSSEITTTAENLAELMRESPNAIEKNLVQAGSNLVGVFSDINFTSRGFAKLKQMKIQVLKDAILDISSGVTLMRSSSMGLTFRNNKIVTFVTPHGTPPEGTLVFSVSWKDVASFRHWRKAEDNDVPQDVINAAIYFLTVEMSQLL